MNNTIRHLDNGDFEVLPAAQQIDNSNNTLRGHEMYQDSDGIWKFSDTNEPTETTWFNRPCGRCGMVGNSNDGLPDPCLGNLPGVTNACCGHGDPNQAYVVFNNGIVLRGFTIEKLKILYSDKANR